MEKRIVTISREFGSGGRTIGKQVAEQLGIPCYDKELIERVAEKTGFHEEYIRQNAEQSPAKHRFSYSFMARGVNGVSAEDYLWLEQRKVILELAEKEPCVIVGRCADYILRERPDCLHVFVHAALEKRADRVVNLYGETEEKPQKRVQEKDKKRKLNYQYYTDRRWGMSQNYHIALDSGALGIEKCSEIIIELYQNK